MGQAFRVGIALAAAASIGFAVHDSLGGVSPTTLVTYDAAHRVFALTRIGLAVLAILIAGRAAEKPPARLLAVACVAASLNVSWEFYAPGLPFWTAVTIDYAAGGVALFAFMRFAATFTDGDVARIRATISRFAPLVGMLVAVLGFARPALFFGTSIDESTLAAFLRPIDVALWIVTPIGWLSVMTAAVAGYFAASEADRARMLLAVVSLGFYALAICVHGLVRIITHHDTFLGSAIDAGALAVATLGLAIAVLRQRLLDVEYYVDRAVVFSLSASILLLLAWLFEEFLGPSIIERLSTLPPFEQESGRARLTFHASLALGLSLLVGKVHGLAEGTVRRFLFRERDQAIASIGELQERMGTFEDAATLERELVNTIVVRLRSEGAAIYRGSGIGRFDLVQQSGDVTWPAQAADVGFGDAGTAKPRIVEARDFMSGTLAVPMIVKRLLFGFLACAPARTKTAYAPDVLRSLEALSREAGLALYALSPGALTPGVE